MKVVVVATGELAEGDLRHLGDADMIVAADGGGASVERAGHRVDLLVGDLDSAAPDVVERLEGAGTRVQRHPTDKDASDTELAVRAGVEAGASSVILLGATGGDRLDHELANLLLLVDPAFAGIDVRLVRAGTAVRAVRAGESLRIEAPIGGIVTLLPVGGDAQGVTTEGLRWALDGAALHIGPSRGLSNEVTGSPAAVRVERGALLVVEIVSEGATST